MKRIAMAWIGAVAVVMAWLGPVPLSAVEAPLELKWDQLIPPPPANLRRTPKPFFAGREVDLGSFAPPGDDTAPPPPLAEGQWMSKRKASSSAPPPVVQSLDGKLVHIGGYVVPLDFDATNVKEFLLVPFVGACIHVPPPPANQIIYVKAARGFDVKSTFDPVWVTGTLKVTPAFTGLADAGYTLEAEKVEPRPGG